MPDSRLYALAILLPWPQEVHNNMYLFVKLRCAPAPLGLPPAEVSTAGAVGVTTITKKSIFADINRQP